MPQQVWQTEDGTIFKSEIEAIRYEESDELFRNFYDGEGKRKEQLPDFWDTSYDWDFQISTRLMRMFVNEFTNLSDAVSEVDGLNELKNRLKDLKTSKWLFPNEP